MRETKFKHTDVGLVPEDWEVKPLERVCQINGRIGFRGYTKADLVEKGEGAFTIGGKHITNNRLDLSDPEFISWKKYYESPEIMVKTGDIVLAQRGTLGRSAIIRTNIGAATINPSLVLLNKIKCDNFYLSYYLQGKTALDYVGYCIGQTSVPMLSQKQIGEMPMVYPPLPEQQRIASALSNVDGLLARLDKLIAKKQAIKKGAMQQLLTGRKRLPGFTEPWEEKRLDEVCEVLRGSILKSSDFIDGDIPVVAGGISIAGYHNKANRQGCSITISASGANAGYVAFYSTPIFASDCSTIQEGTGFSLKFIYYVLSNRQKEIYELQAGGAQPHIHPKDLNPLMINIPSSLAEQRAIARILTHMDKEIDALRAERRKTEAIKQGMMQQLLTGKIRLI